MLVNVDEKNLKDLTDSILKLVPKEEYDEVCADNKAFRSLNNTGDSRQAKGFSKKGEFMAVLGVPPTFHFLLTNIIPNYFTHKDREVRTARLNFIKRHYPEFKKGV